MKYEVRASKVENGTGNVVGMASIVIEDKFAVSNIRIIQKEEGDLSVMYPARKTQKTDSGYMNIVHPYTSELSYSLKDAILEAYGTGEHKVVETEAVFKLETKVNLYDKNNLEAFCDVKFSEENEFAIHDITIRKGKEKGTVFVAMPTYVKKDGSFDQICNPITKEFREELCNKLLDEYYKKALDKDKAPEETKEESVEEKNMDDDSVVSDEKAAVSEEKSEKKTNERSVTYKSKGSKSR